VTHLVSLLMSASLLFFTSLGSLFLLFFLYCYRDHRDLHSFPTRRSSDLTAISNTMFRLTGSHALAEPYSISAGCQVVTNMAPPRSEEHTSELQSRFDLVCRLLLEKKKENKLNEPTRTNDGCK